MILIVTWCISYPIDEYLNDVDIVSTGWGSAKFASFPQFLELYEDDS